MLLGLAAFALVSTGATSCGETGSPGSSDQASPSQSSPPKKKHKKKKVNAKPQFYAGVGSKNLGTIVVPVDSTLTWSQKGSTNFILGNDFNDDNQLNVNAIGHGPDTSQVAAGTYHKVDVIGDNWQMKIVPNK
jgi:hypothetical protein